MFPTVNTNPKTTQKEIYLHIESIYPSSGSSQGGRQEGLTPGKPRAQVLLCQRIFAPVGKSKFHSADPSARCRTFAGAIFCLFCFISTFPESIICYFSQVRSMPVPRLPLPVDLHSPALQDTPNQQNSHAINTDISLCTSLCTQVPSETLQNMKQTHCLLV